MRSYRQQWRPEDKRLRETRWPHFDRRGPDFYYDEERHPERTFDGYRTDRRYDDRFGDSDIYEDEFAQEDQYYGRYNNQRDDQYHRQLRDQYDRWPEDRFYYHRQQLRPQENFFERGWHRLRDQWREMNGLGPSYGPYPEDHHHGPYGHEYRSHNRNRGRGDFERFRR